MTQNDYGKRKSTHIMWISRKMKRETSQIDSNLTMQMFYHLKTKNVFSIVVFRCSLHFLCSKVSILYEPKPE